MRTFSWLSEDVVGTRTDSGVDWPALRRFVVWSNLSVSRDHARAPERTLTYPSGTAFCPWSFRSCGRSIPTSQAAEKLIKRGSVPESRSGVKTHRFRAVFGTDESVPLLQSAPMRVFPQPFQLRGDGPAIHLIRRLSKVAFRPSRVSSPDSALFCKFRPDRRPPVGSGVINTSPRASSNWLFPDCRWSR